jgi:hypothetical protein
MGNAPQASQDAACGRGATVAAGDLPASPPQIGANEFLNPTGRELAVAVMDQEPDRLRPVDERLLTRSVGGSRLSACV